VDRGRSVRGKEYATSRTDKEASSEEMDWTAPCGPLDEIPSADRGRSETGEDHQEFERKVNRNRSLAAISDDAGGAAAKRGEAREDAQERIGQIAPEPTRADTEPIAASGIEAILSAGAELETTRKEKEVVVDALLVQEILGSIVHYFAPTEDAEEKQAIIDLIIESVINCDLNYGEKAAIEWGDGWKWKQEQIDTDMELFMQSGMDIKVMAANRLKALKSDRLNPQRVDSLRADNPERARLLGLCDGMVVPKPEGFIPNGATSKKGLHKVYKRVHSAVDKRLGDLHSQQLGFVLTEQISREAIVHHRMLSKWAPKKGKKCGRNIGDLSYGEKPYLNGKWAKNAAAAMWGPIEHPTIEDIAAMILDLWEEILTGQPDASWSDLVMWKMDLKGAYTLVDVHPDEVGMFAQEMMDGLMYYHLCGVFGWSCTPAAF
jgi:hypothetical protein